MPDRAAAAPITAAPGTAIRLSDSPVTVLLHLRASRVSVLLELHADRLPVVLHWGRDLGELGPADAAAVRTLGAGRLLASIVPEAQPGWQSRAGIQGSRSGRGWQTGFNSVRSRLLSGTRLPYGDLVEVGPDTLIVQATDSETGLDLDLAVQLTPAGLLRCRAGVTNRGDEVYQLDALDLFVPVGDAQVEWLDLGDSTPNRLVRLPAASGHRSGKSLLGVGEPGAGHRAGSVWLAHVAFSGAQRLRFEHSTTGIGYIGGGELLAPGEVRLAVGGSYHTPWLCWVWGEGLDDAAGRFHDQLRTRRSAAGVTHPIVFDASGPEFSELDRHAMLKLAEYAAAVGAEVIVLDVSWCTRIGLDPYADSGSGGHSDRLDDLERLLSRLRGFGLEPGLGIEPELITPDSDIAAEHPDWLLASAPRADGGRLLDLAIVPAMGHVWERLTKLLDRHQVGYLIWRCDPPAVPARSHRGEPTVHGRTLASYRLLDALAERYPHVQIQTVRADLALAGRVQSLTGGSVDMTGSALAQLLPAELTGTRLAPATEPVRTPASVSALSAAFLGQFGLALDLRTLSAAELRLLHGWLTLHKRLRGMLATGRLVRPDCCDSALQVRGMVAADSSEAVFAIGWRERPGGPRTVRLAGLDFGRRYRISPVAGRAGDPYAPVPAWSHLEIIGSAVERAGLVVPDAPAGAGLMLRVEGI